jgi:hypothetical protein
MLPSRTGVQHLIHSSETRHLTGGLLGRGFDIALDAAHLQDGFFQRVADLGFALALPVHMHIGMNACISDYLPKAARGEQWQAKKT